MNFKAGQRIRVQLPLRPDLHVDLIRHQEGWSQIDGDGVFPTRTLRCRGAPGRPSPEAKENGHGLDLDEFPPAEGNRRLPIVGKSRARSVSGGLVGSHHRSRDPPATRHAVAVRRSPFADLGARRLGRSSTRTGPTSRHRLRLGRLPLRPGLRAPCCGSLTRQRLFRSLFRRGDIARHVLVELCAIVGGEDQCVFVAAIRKLNNVNIVGLYRPCAEVVLILHRDNFSHEFPSRSIRCWQSSSQPYRSAKRSVWDPETTTLPLRPNSRRHYTRHCGHLSVTQIEAGAPAVRF